MSQLMTSAETSDRNIVPMLISISKSMRALHGLKLAELGFYNGQDELLLAADTAGIPVSLVADQMAVRPSTVSKMLDRLVAKGLMIRVPDRRDKRRTIIVITAAGVEAREKLLRLRADLELDLSRALREDRRVSIVESLDECQAHLSSRLKRLR